MGDYQCSWEWATQGPEALAEGGGPEEWRVVRGNGVGKEEEFEERRGLGTETEAPAEPLLAALPHPRGPALTVRGWGIGLALSPRDQESGSVSTVTGRVNLAVL